MAYNLQDLYLNQLRRDQQKATFFLLTGEVIEGTVCGFDNFTVAIENPSEGQRLIYKHAISSLAPQKPIQLPPNG